MFKNVGGVSVGLIIFVNFCLIWIPSYFVHSILSFLLKDIIISIYQIFDQSAFVRSLAINYIYSNAQHSDYFVTSFTLLFCSTSLVYFVIYTQIVFQFLSVYVICVFYIIWIGFIGASYSLAHKEGHNSNLYKPWIRSLTFGGHIFENFIGIIYGSVPWNFSTSHISIHHRLDGRVGDTLYLWDLDRSNFYDFLLYLSRVLLHTSGWSPLLYFYKTNNMSKFSLLLRGVITYWGIAILILFITKSFSFLWFIYLEPFLCMTVFVAVSNIGFHAFLEFDENGKHIPEVVSTSIIEVHDVYFGEEDHMTHHYNPVIYYRELDAFRAGQRAVLKDKKASVFRHLSVLELSFLVVFGRWSRLADCFVDYSGEMSKKEIIELLQKRTRRTD